MEGGDDEGAVTGNHAGGTQAQGRARFHHGRGDSVEHAATSEQTLSIWGRLLHRVPPRFAGSAPPAIPLPAIPLLLPPRLPQPSHPAAATAPTERPDPSTAAAAERGRRRPPP